MASKVYVRARCGEGCVAGTALRRAGARGGPSLGRGRSGPRAGLARPLRALDSSVCLSVSQEEFAFALLFAAETLSTARKNKEETGEDTNLFEPTAVVGVIAASSVLIYTRNDLLGRLGLLFAAIAAFYVIGKYSKRFLDAGEGTSEDFPGPKGLPAFGIFASLMAFLAATEALTRV